jgi:CheY-like chemotaxis protein
LVLVADDDPTLHEVLSAFLERAGFSVAGSPSGADAVEAALRLTPAVIVIDHHLPTRDGCDVALQIKRDWRTSDIPIVLWTNHLEAHVAEMAQRVGCEGFVDRLPSFQRLLEEIWRSIRCGERKRPPRRNRILVVEDDASVRQGLASILEDQGYQVAQAADGAEALTYLRGHRRERPNLILLDLMMPNMNGWQFCAAQRREPWLAEIPVVLLTALPGAERDREELGAASCLQKPLRSSRLVEVIEAQAHA